MVPYENFHQNSPLFTNPIGVHAKTMLFLDPMVLFIIAISLLLVPKTFFFVLQVFFLLQQSRVQKILGLQIAVTTFWSLDCCKHRYQGGTCSYSNLDPNKKGTPAKIFLCPDCCKNRRPLRLGRIGQTFHNLFRPKYFLDENVRLQHSNSIKSKKSVCCRTAYKRDENSSETRN